MWNVPVKKKCLEKQRKEPVSQKENKYYHEIGIDRNKKTWLQRYDLIP